MEHDADEWSKKRQRGDYEDAQLRLVQSIRELVNPDVLIGSRSLRDMETSPGVGRFGLMHGAVRGAGRRTTVHRKAANTVDAGECDRNLAIS